VSAFFVIALIPAWIMGRRRRDAVAEPHPEPMGSDPLKKAVETAA
jgi:hypothetical protein